MFLDFFFKFPKAFQYTSKVKNYRYIGRLNLDHHALSYQLRLCSWLWISISRNLISSTHKQFTIYWRDEHKRLEFRSSQVDSFMPSTFPLQWAWRAVIPWGSPVLSLAKAACSILRTLTTPGRLALIAPTLWRMVEDSSPLLEALYPTPFGYHWCELKFVPTFHMLSAVSISSPPPQCCVCACSFMSSTLFQLSSAIYFVLAA